MYIQYYACTTVQYKPHAASKIATVSEERVTDRAVPFLLIFLLMNKGGILSFSLHLSYSSMTSGRLLCAVVRATAWSIAVQRVAAFFGVPTVTWVSSRNIRRITSGSADRSSSACGIRARAGSTKSPLMWPNRSSLRDTDVTDVTDVRVIKDPTVEDMSAGDTSVDVELGEGEELLGTVEVTPEQIADFFAQPS